MSNTKSEYKTVKCAGESLFIEKKSKFIGNAVPVKTEKEALDFINAVKKQYADARHNVYAYVVRENNMQRYTDDGEPSGTAGMPVLDCIRKQELTDIAVVVTRYFGGTLLGTGGLVHAYGKSASEAIAAAKPVIKRLCKIYSVVCDYTLLGTLQHFLENYITENIEYTDKVEFTVGVGNAEEEKFKEDIIRAANGRVDIRLVGESFSDVEI